MQARIIIIIIFQWFNLFILEIFFQSKKITQVACGSAHTLAWSTNKPCSNAGGSNGGATGNLPTTTPLEYDLVQDLSVNILRNRLVLLHHFSEQLCPTVAMFRPDSFSAGGEVSLDKLRGLLVGSIKEATFKKVTIQNIFARGYQLIDGLHLGNPKS